MKIFGYHITTKRTFGRRITALIGDDYDFLSENEKKIIACNIGIYNASTLFVIVPVHQKFRDLDYFMGPQFHNAYKLKVGDDDNAPYIHYQAGKNYHTTTDIEDAGVFTRAETEELLRNIPHLVPIPVTYHNV